MRRKLLTFASGLSLLLCVAVCLLWVRSYPVSDNVQRYRLSPGDPKELYQLFTAPGAVGYGRIRLDDPSKQHRWPRSSTAWHWVHEPRPAGVPHQRKWSWLGFASWDVPLPPGNGGGGVRGFQIPLWSIALLFGVLSTRSLTEARRWRRAVRRRRSGLCPAC